MYNHIEIEKKWQKNENCSSKGSCHNGKAKFSSEISIFENIKKVKKKNNKKLLCDLYKEIKTKKWIIIFNWKNLNKHFSQKDNKDFRIRKSFWETIIYALDKLYFENNNIWYFAFKNIIFKVVLWQQNNWYYFVKSYYLANNLTKRYQKYVKWNLILKKWKMYNHIEIEKKWQDYWEQNKTFKILNNFNKPKYYCLDMFPYPSGAWLHVGHPEWYTANDIIARYKNAKGFNVLHPMGWDAFWLPAENYAIKTWTHPRVTTDANIDNIRKQIKALWISYDWDREIDTTDPKYYKWTQWIFLRLFEAWLAYEQDLPINYCSSCKTWLANEEVLNDFTCERCWTKVEQRKIRQWVLAITKYADRLLYDVDKLDWPEGIKDMQRNWIGRSEWCEFEMKIVTKKWGLPLPKRGGHNDLAESSSNVSIFENMSKVKKKIKFSWKIEWVIEVWDKKINFNSVNILSHFRWKHYKEFINRKNLLATVFTQLENIEFDEYNIWYFLFKKKAIKIVLWKQSNWNYFVKSYYTYDKFTEKYKRYLDVNKNIWKISVYTTRIDTVFAWTFAILWPDSPQVHEFITSEYKKECNYYINKTKQISNQDRILDNKEVTWVFTWSYVINPFNKKEVPVWIADFVLWNYWTWAVTANAHDERDFKLAKKYGIPLKVSILPNKCNEEQKNKILNFEDCFTDYWILINSWKFDWLNSKEAKIKLTEYAEEKWFWKRVVNYKLRDWLFSRQRYWGEPIPLIHLENDDVESLEKIEHKKSENSYSKNLEGVTRNGNTAKFSLFQYSILEFTKKVKKKDDKKLFFSLFYELETKKGTIIFNWKKLINHFSIKDRKERNFRISFWETILKYIDNIYYESELIWYLVIREKIFRIILEKLWDKKYEIKTYYSSLKYAKLYNKAYIREKSDWDYLYIKWKQFSKIYNWLYGFLVCDYNLPLELPNVTKYEPSWDGTSPLTKVKNFVNIELAENLNWKRETNTMPQWWWSCWYYLRYMDNLNDDELVNKEIVNYWWEVDSYVWWAEHAVLHLLYARFWHKFLFDIWIVPTDEPFYRLRNQWLILAHAFQRKNGWLLANDLVEEKNGKFYEIDTWIEVNRIISKMSKSLKNVINPDDIIKEYWADSLRLYEMYMAEFKDTAPWDTKGIIWVRRFLDKVDRLFGSEPKISNEDDDFIKKLLHKTIKKVWEDIESYKFNTAIASMMILVNNWLPKDEENQNIWKNIFLRLLHPFAPHLAEELWEKLGNKKSIFFSLWPEYDEKLIVDDIIIIWVQVLWKLRWEIEISVDEDKNSVLKKAKDNEGVAKWLEWKEIVKEIYVPCKIVNLVIK